MTLIAFTTNPIRHGHKDMKRVCICVCKHIIYIYITRDIYKMNKG